MIEMARLAAKTKFEMRNSKNEIRGTEEDLGASKTPAAEGGPYKGQKRKDGMRAMASVGGKVLKIQV